MSTPETLIRRIGIVSPGKVSIDIPHPSNPKFYARSYPTTQRARENVITELEASGKSSLTAVELTMLIDEAKDKQIEVGIGATVESALTDLLAKLKAAKKAAPPAKE